MLVADKNRMVRTIVVLAIVCFFLQIALAPNIALGNGHANFAVIFVMCSTTFLSPGSSAVAGFVSGLLFDLSSTAPIGLMAFCLSVAGYALSFEGRERVPGEFGVLLIRGGIASLGVSLVYHLAMLLVGQGGSLFDVIFLRTLPTALLTFLFLLPFLFFFSRMRSSGPSLGSGMGGGGHLSRRGL